VLARKNRDQINAQRGGLLLKRRGAIPVRRASGTPPVFGRAKVSCRFGAELSPL
jgi:hypothetical protein